MACHITRTLEESNFSFLSIVELGSLLRHTKMGEKVKEFLNYLPKLEIDTSLHAITRTVQRVKIEDPFHNHTSTTKSS